MKKIYTAIQILFFLLFLANSVFAQELGSDAAKRLISGNSTGVGISKEDLQNSIITNAYHDKLSGLDLVYVQQSYLGIPVYNTIQVLAFKDGKSVSTSGGRVYRIGDRVENKKATSPVTAREAVNLAAKSVGLSAELAKESLSVLRTSPDNLKVEFGQTAFTWETVTADKMWVQDSLGGIHLAWQVRLAPSTTSDYWLIRVDAQNGEILGKDNLTVYDNWGIPQRKIKTSLIEQKNSSLPAVQNEKKQALQVINNASYRVIPYPAADMDHPGGTPILVTNPWDLAGPGNNATTLKWHNDGATDYNITRGNNVWAKEDTLGNNTGGGPATSSTNPNLTFDFSFDPNLRPQSPNNEYFAITNLFYWNNIMHDLSYQYGFDEISGNFQYSNMGRGGQGGDYVLADAQDGSGRNNANFVTPADGGRPRMQMFLFDNLFGNLVINSPSQYAGVFVQALEGNLSTANLLKDIGSRTGDLVLYNDDASGTTHLGCAVAANAGDLAGKIALIDRGDCNFSIKVKNAQNAGAIGAIVVNADNTLIIMGSDPIDNTITIPALNTYKDAGDFFKSLIASNIPVNVTMKATIDLDGDLDNTVITHEYTHGISTRLTGGPATSSCLSNSEQGGEGWSDYMALMTTTDWATASVTDGAKPRPIGTYVNSEDADGYGIRTYPYSTDMSIDKWTYDSLANNGEVHLVGEIWATVLWDMTWNIIQQSGINTNLFNADGTGGNSDALKLVILGMKLQPCDPGFLDGRDAILKADQILFNGKYSCAIWDAFARRGMGVNAKQGSSNNTKDQTANKDIPSGATIHKSVDLSESPQNGILNYTITVAAQCQSITGLKVVDTLSTDVTYISGGTYNPSDRTVIFTVPGTVQPQQTTTFNLKVRVNNGIFVPESTLFSESVANNSIPSTFTAVTNKNVNWVIHGDTVHSPQYALKAAGPLNGLSVEQILTVVNPIHVTGHVQLSFWQMVNTENAKDGGVVELSTDNITWVDAGPYMVQNGYNSIIHTSNSNLDNKPAFSGTPYDDFSQTIVNLSAFTNQDVYFRFRYVADNREYSSGWYIDDIEVKKYSAVYNVARAIGVFSQVYSLSDTFTRITAEVLPVIWERFTVQKDANSAQLKWSTASESNSDMFYIERSVDGVHFSELGSVKAAGNSSLVNEYRFSDQSPYPGNNFYRIRLTDKDGKVSYSTTKNLVFDELVNSAVRISPNPAFKEAELWIPGNRSLLNVEIFDASGRILNNWKMGSEKLRIPLSTLAEGIYYIRIKGEGLDLVRKLVKSK